MREAAEQFAKIVRIQVEAFRDEHGRTGRRGWDALPMTRQ
jgi:hypothetical protein